MGARKEIGRVREGGGVREREWGERQTDSGIGQGIDKERLACLLCFTECSMFIYQCINLFLCLPVYLLSV